MKSVLSYLSKMPTPVTLLAGPFRGAQIVLNPAHSKRKIFGIYEHVLNRWLSHVLPLTEVVWDVGANDGYFTYGCAQVMQRYRSKSCVIAFEPGLVDQPGLSLPAKWSHYATVKFEFVPQFVGAVVDESTTTLNKAYSDRPHLHNKPSLVKVDVEGGEVEVLLGAAMLLQAPHHWVVEVHGDELLESVLDCFANANRTVQVYPSQPHWLFGAECRTIKTSWVTTHPYV